MSGIIAIVIGCVGHRTPIRELKGQRCENITLGVIALVGSRLVAGAGPQAQCKCSGEKKVK